MTQARHRSRRGSLALLVLAASAALLCAPPSAQAQVWTISGPEDGFVSQIVVHPTIPDLVYAVALDGVARSTDGGVTWTPTSLERTYYLSTLVVDGNVPGQLFVRAGASILRSTDDGASWSEVLRDGSLMGLAANSDSQPLVLFAWMWLSRLFRSSDLGETWVELTEGIDSQDPDIQLTDLLPLPNDVELLLAAVGGSVYRSEDGGSSWTMASAGIDREIDSLAMGDGDDQSVWAAGHVWDGEWENPVFTTTDGGWTWRRVAAVPGPEPVQRLVVCPHRPHELYAIASRGLSQSTNTGVSWRPVPGFDQLDRVHTVAYDPIDPRQILVGGALFPHGVCRSDDAGGSWTPSTAGLPRVRLGDLELDPQNPARIYAVAVSASLSPHGGVYRSTDGGEAWELLGGSEQAHHSLSLSPSAPGLIFAGGRGVQHSSDGGSTWIADDSELAEEFIYTVAVDPHRPATVFAATSDDLYRSQDSGQSWQRLTADGRSLEFVVSIEFLPDQPGSLYAVNGWEVRFSQDSGDTWSSLWVGGQDPWGRPAAYELEIDPVDDRRLCLATDTGMYRSLDGGLSWQRTSTGIEVSCRTVSPPKTSFPVVCDGPSSVVASPTQAGTVFVATGRWFDPRYGTGVYRSRDFGQTWQPFSRGLDGPGGIDLEITPDGRTLYLAASQGGVAVLHLDPIRTPGGRVP